MNLLPENNHSDILLVAVNARYSHCSFAARSLIANLGELMPQAAMLECDLEITPVQLAERIVARHPRIVGFSVYLWNVRLVESAARVLRLVAPEIKLVAGGPEITTDYPQVALFDAIITGEGESSFHAFCAHAISHPLTAPSSPFPTPNSQLLTPHSQLPHPSCMVTAPSCMSTPTASSPASNRR